MHVFWQKGYEGTSISDLMDAMGLTKSSIYKAFENKERLFGRVVERYHRDYLGFRQEALAEPTPRRIAERLLTGMSDLHYDDLTPPGCLEANAAVACSTDAEPIRLELARNREGFRLQLRDRFDETSKVSPLPLGMTSDDASSLVFTLIMGLAVQAKAGVDREASARVVRAALLSWADR